MVGFCRNAPNLTNRTETQSWFTSPCSVSVLHCSSSLLLTPSPHPTSVGYSARPARRRVRWSRLRIRCCSGRAAPPKSNSACSSPPGARRSASAPWRRPAWSCVETRSGILGTGQWRGGIPGTGQWRERYNLPGTGQWRERYTRYRSVEGRHTRSTPVEGAV